MTMMERTIIAVVIATCCISFLAVSGENQELQECNRNCSLAGVPGVPGVPGAAGVPGIPGLHGPKGDIGQQGDPGPKCIPGDIGNDGPRGPEGPKGSEGSGLPGKMGPKGPKGEEGMLGDRGPQGPRGTEGIGLPGPIGQKGEKGIMGPPGENGENGTNYQLQKSAFSVAVTNIRGQVPTNAPLKYNIVITNVGNDYSQTTGKFTCRIPGTYVFSFVAMKSETTGSEAAGLHLKLNGVSHFGTFCHDSNSRSSSTNMGILNLSIGDQVWIQPFLTRFYSNDGKYTTFSGFLLYPE